nr:hypothetical protein GCM10017547_35040 [Pseudarthrobacter oxydans]
MAHDILRRPCRSVMTVHRMACVAWMVVPGPVGLVLVPGRWRGGMAVVQVLALRVVHVLHGAGTLVVGMSGVSPSGGARPGGLMRRVHG